MSARISAWWTRRSIIAAAVTSSPKISPQAASYSPDGDWIIYASDGEAGAADLYVMRADGTGARPLVRAEPWDSAPDWGPATG